MTTQKCRACLRSITKTFPLTKPVIGCTPDITYAQLLKEYAQFEYNTVYERHMPQNLCYLCCSQLKSTYIFIQQAKHCNVKLINDLSKQLCLQEQVIDLPQLEDEASVSIKKEYLGNHDNVDDQDDRNFIANEDNRNHENNFVRNKLFKAEPILTTEQIIEYDIEDNFVSNKSFIVEPNLTTEEIIEYDEDSVEMDNDNFSTESDENTSVINREEEASFSNKIENLESVDTIQSPVCNERMAKRDKLENHMRIHHDISESSFFNPSHNHKLSSKDQTFRCEKCLCIYNNKYEYIEHIKEKHNSDQAKIVKERMEKQNAANAIIKCRFCDHVAKTYSGLKYHNRSKHPTEYKKLKCNFCSYSTILNKYTLLNHIKTVHKELIKKLRANAVSNTDEGIKPYTNNELNDNCSTKNLITTPTDEEHISDSNDNEQDKELRDENFIRNILNMKQKISKSLVRRCEKCGKILKNYKSLLEHQRHVHKSEDMFSVCPYCDKKCKRDSDLKIHIRQMHGPLENRQVPKPRSKEKRFMCAECSYTCTTSTVLNIHIRLHHTGERPYKCDICSKSFVVQHDLKIHRYLHTGEKPYKCSVCLKSFRDPSHMRRHKRLHTNKNPFTCDDCGKGFTQSYNLSVHKRTHLKGNKLSCSVCGKFFKNKSILNIHQINENHYDEVA